MRKIFKHFYFSDHAFDIIVVTFFIRYFFHELFHSYQYSLAVCLHLCFVDSSKAARAKSISLLPRVLICEVFIQPENNFSVLLFLNHLKNKIKNNYNCLKVGSFYTCKIKHYKLQWQQFWWIIHYKRNIYLPLQTSIHLISNTFDNLKRLISYVFRLS